MFAQLMAAPWWVKAILGVGAVFVALIVVGAIAGGGGDDEDSDIVAEQTQQPTTVAEETSRPTAEPTEAPTAEPTPEVTEPPEQDNLNLAVGQTAQIGDAQVTVHSWRIDPGSEFLKPDADKQWIVVDATVVNTGDDEYAMSTLLQMSIRDSDGREHGTPALGAETSGSLDGVIPPGQNLRGEVAIEVPATSTGLQFVFGQSFGGEQARWNLN
jgi:hypothetical protein